MIYPVESLIYGLFFMAALFFVIGTVYRISSTIMYSRMLVGAQAYNTLQRLMRFYLGFAFVFIILAIGAGLLSSYIGAGDIQAVTEIID